MTILTFRRDITRPQRPTLNAGNDATGQHRVGVRAAHIVRVIFCRWRG